MKRHFSNWLDAYMEYLEETEPAKVFHKWTGISSVASALRKKISLKVGRLEYYPNLYIILVAEPGRARKSNAMDYGIKLLNELPDIHMSSDSITREALIGEIEQAQGVTVMPDGENFMHNSITIMSKEFETFLGQKKENTKMVVLLTDLFDAQGLAWRYSTKGSGSNSIQSVFVNLMGATTPESLASSLPSSAIGGGLTSRMLFVWADKKYMKCAAPPEPDKEFQRNLIEDLSKIGMLAGQYRLSDDAMEQWIKWYEAYDEDDPNRFCESTAFNGWYSRKPTYIMKLCMISAASRSNDLIIEWRNIAEAIKWVEEIEPMMGSVFRAVGKSFVSAEVDMIMNIVKNRKAIDEKALLSIVWSDMDAQKFDNVVNTAVRTGKVVRTIGRDGIMYYDAEYKAKLELQNIKKREGGEV